MNAVEKKALKVKNKQNDGMTRHNLGVLCPTMAKNNFRRKNVKITAQAPFGTGNRPSFSIKAQ